MINEINKVSSLSATRDLGSVSSIASDSMTSQSPTPGEQTGLNFASILGNMSVQAMNNIKQAEVSSFEGIQGKANTREVVDAVLSAEQSLQTAIAMRDKIVSAYLEITKMQI